MTTLKFKNGSSWVEIPLGGSIANGYYEVMPDYVFQRTNLYALINNAGSGYQVEVNFAGDAEPASKLGGTWSKTKLKYGSKYVFQDDTNGEPMYYGGKIWDDYYNGSFYYKGYIWHKVS